MVGEIHIAESQIEEEGETKYNNKIDVKIIITEHSAMTSRTIPDGNGTVFFFFVRFHL